MDEMEGVVTASEDDGTHATTSTIEAQTNPTESLGLLDLGPKIIEPGHPPEKLSTAPGMTYTHRNLYWVRLGAETELHTFLIDIARGFVLLDLMGVDQVLLMSRLFFRSGQPDNILAHCVTRGPTPHAQTIYGSDEELQLWHLTNPDDYDLVQFNGDMLYQLGAVDVQLVVKVNPVGITLPHPAAIDERVAAFQRRQQQMEALAVDVNTMKL